MPTRAISAVAELLVIGNFVTYALCVLCHHLTLNFDVKYAAPSFGQFWAFISIQISMPESQTDGEVQYTADTYTEARKSVDSPSVVTLLCVNYSNANEDVL